MLILTSIILLTLCVSGFLVAKLLGKYAPPTAVPRMPALTMSLWFIAAAVWGRPFFEIRIPGLLDLTIDRILLIGMILLLLAGLFTGSVDFRKKAGMELTLLAFILACLISMTAHGFSPSLPSLPSPWNIFINGYLIPIIAFLFAKFFIQRFSDIRLVFNTLFLLGVYLSVTSFFEFFDLHSFVFPRYISNPDILIHLDRARGPFLNAAFNGAAITFGFICGLHLLPGKTRLARALHLALLSLSPPAIFFTQTRSVYLGFLLVLGLFLCFYRTPFPKWKTLALPMAIFMVFIIANIPRLTSEDRREGGVGQVHEIEIRLALINRSMNIAAMAPFFGVGMGQFIPISAGSLQGETFIRGIEEESQHFQLLGLLAELGITGTGLYLVIIVLIFKRLARLKRVLPETGFISGNFTLALAAVWVVHLTTNLFLEPSYCLFFNAVPFAFAGLADGMCAHYA